jgi:glycosyltransferase involved in cell wall biosynthesis
MKAIAAFYCSRLLGSDYRVGFEYIKFAYENGFDTAIISNIENNITHEDLLQSGISLNLIKLNSPIKSQKNLYKFTDFFAQLIWHLNVATYLKKQRKEIDLFWVSTSSAQPWFPLNIYIPLAKKIIWGAVGGGGVPPNSVLFSFDLKTIFREILRGLIDNYFIKIKVELIKKHANKILVLTRTVESKNRFENLVGLKDVLLVPEFLEISHESSLKKEVGGFPIFIWAGQDIPRKNINLAFIFYKKIKEYFPNALMHVYGIEDRGRSEEGITFYGWVDVIDWEAYRSNGVLLISSFREGLSTVLIEAVSEGLLCISTPVGAIPSFDIENLLVIPHESYPKLDEKFMIVAATAIKRHLIKRTIRLRQVDFHSQLRDYINSFVDL